MTTSSYPGMAQSFSMTHGTNMTTVAGMRQDAMSEFIQLALFSAGWKCIRPLNAMTKISSQIGNETSWRRRAFILVHLSGNEAISGAKRRFLKLSSSWIFYLLNICHKIKKLRLSKAREINLDS